MLLSSPSRPYNDPEYKRNRATLLAGRPACVGFPRGRHPRPVPATTANHRIPLIHGGTHALENLEPMCGTCNSRQSRRSDIRGTNRRARYEVRA